MSDRNNTGRINGQDGAIEYSMTELSTGNCAMTEGDDREEVLDTATKENSVVEVEHSPNEDIIDDIELSGDNTALKDQLVGDYPLTEENGLEDIEGSSHRGGTYESDILTNLPSLVAARSYGGIGFQRHSIADGRHNHTLHQLVENSHQEDQLRYQRLPESDGSSDRAERSGSFSSFFGRIMGKGKDNKVSPEVTEPIIGDDEIEDIDMGHHRVNLDNIETDADRLKTVQLIRALPCPISDRRRLLCDHDDECVHNSTETSSFTHATVGAIVILLAITFLECVVITLTTHSYEADEEDL